MWKFQIVAEKLHKISVWFYVILHKSIVFFYNFVTGFHTCVLGGKWLTSYFVWSVLWRKASLLIFKLRMHLFLLRVAANRVLTHAHQVKPVETAATHSKENTDFIFYFMLLFYCSVFACLYIIPSRKMCGLILDLRIYFIFFLNRQISILFFTFVTDLIYRQWLNVIHNPFIYVKHCFGTTYIWIKISKLLAYTKRY